MSMKRTVISVLLILCFVITGLPGEVSAAAVKLNKKSFTLEVGQAFQLKISGTKKKVTWSSSNKKIAAVSRTGRVKGVKAGTAAIKAKVSGKTYSAKVKVMNKQLKAVLNYKTPDGSKVTEKKIDGKTVAIIPYGTTFSLNQSKSSKNHGILGYHVTQCGDDPEKPISALEGLCDLYPDMDYDITKVLKEYGYLYGYVKYKEEDEPYWGLMMDKKMDVYQLGDYKYFEISIYDQDGIAEGSVTHYFRFS